VTIDVVRLRSGGTSATIEPAFGGRIGQITVGGQPLLIDPPASRDPLLWGAYPMAPWVGRLRHGRFTFDGVDHQMVLDHRDGDEPDRQHAIHGLVYRRPWAGSDATSPSTWTGRLDLDWALGGEVRHTIELHPNRLHATLEVRSTGSRFPAEVGWHPWFRRPEAVEFTPSAMYERDDVGIPTGRLIAPGAGPWDDCFVASGPVVLHYERDHARVVTIDCDCDHWVIYDVPVDAICVEPQSGPPDAFNLTLDHTPHVVEPGRPVRRTMTIAW
jgi:aldose 1-epimerase